MSDWVYIDEIEKFPDVEAAFCDTRGFHIICFDKYTFEDTPIEMSQIKKDELEDYMYAREEILGWLKSLEVNSGGKHDWRYLSFNVDKKDKGHNQWIKYIRFYKTECNGMTGYFAYTNLGNFYIPLKRGVYVEENIKRRALNWDDDD